MELRSSSTGLFVDALRTLPVTPIEAEMVFVAHGVVRGRYRREAEYHEACAQHNIVPDFKVNWKYDPGEGMFLPANYQGVSQSFLFQFTWGSIHSSEVTRSGASEYSKKLSAAAFRKGGKPQVLHVELTDNQQTRRRQLELFQGSELDAILADGYEPRYGTVTLSTEERGCCETSAVYPAGMLRYDLKDGPNMSIEGKLRAPVVAWFNRLKEKYEVTL